MDASSTQSVNVQYSGPRHLMRTSTEFMSSISAPTNPTSFGFRDLVKGRWMCIVLCPSIVQITMCSFDAIPCHTSTPMRHHEVVNGSLPKICHY